MIGMFDKMASVGLRFDGQIVLVTGGTSGIGRAVALEFASRGACVAIAARRAALGTELVSEIKSRGGEAIFIPTDVCRAQAIIEMVRNIIDHYGRLDCAFNNAGIAGEMFKCCAEQTEESWDAVMNTNLKGLWLSMKHEISEMLRFGKGCIVNCASIFGFVAPDFGVAPYVASKHGVIGLTRAAAVEYARHNIRVNAVCPGITLSEMAAPDAKRLPPGIAELIRLNVPMNRIGTPQEIARGVLWLCSADASFMTGQTLTVDGGWLAR